MEKLKYLPDNYNEQDMKEQFEESYYILCSINETFDVKMEKIFKLKKINAAIFVERTGLLRQYYSHFRAKKYIPRMDTFISMCMGLNLDLPTAESLLDSLRLGFEKTNRIHCAYMFLLTHYQGLCIDSCNEILCSLGINEEKYLLGTFTKEDREEK